MSRNNGYSFRGSRGGTEPPEKKQKIGLSANDGSCVLYIGSVPKDWNDSIVRSVVAGSGSIVDIRVRIDPSGRTKNYVFVEYAEPSEARKGLDLLNQVTLGPNRKLRVELSKEGLRATRSDRPALQLVRESLPYYVGLPPAMIQNVPLPANFQQPDSAPPVATTPSFSLPQPKVELPMPEVLAKASQFLPPFNADAFVVEDKISQNLQALTPPQMIELIATLKTLVSVDQNTAYQALGLTDRLPAATAQALLLMGLIKPDVITAALQVTAPTRARATPPMAAAPPVAPSHNAYPHPRWPSLPGYVGAKLAQLPPDEANTVAQVLQLPPNVVETLPLEQKNMIEDIRRRYL